VNHELKIGRVAWFPCLYLSTWRVLTLLPEVQFLPRVWSRRFCVRRCHVLARVPSGITGDPHPDSFHDPGSFLGAEEAQEKPDSYPYLTVFGAICGPVLFLLWLSSQKQVPHPSEV